MGAFIMKITFLEDVEVLDHNKQVEQSFKAGETVELNGPSARYWIGLGYAVEVKGKTAPAATQAATEDAEEKPAKPAAKKKKKAPAKK